MLKSNVNPRSGSEKIFKTKKSKASAKRESTISFFVG